MKFFPIFFAFCTVSIWAAPQGAKVVSGKAILSKEKGQTLIETSPKTVIEWDSFSIDRNEHVRFQQLDQSSTVLNRVLGGGQSALLGALTSNGKVYLINPNGVLIGPNARIEAASFIGSSLDILDADFLNDRLLFSGEGKGSVIHLGSISCPYGHVALIARQVENKGEIQASEGSVLLASTSTIFLEIDGALIRPQSKEYPALLETGKNPYSEAIRLPDDEDEATEIREAGGRVFLWGPIDVSGEKGGTVHLLGEDIRLFDPAKVEASGVLGGGQVFIGGHDEGKNGPIANAKNVQLSRGVQLSADALEKGNGGKVIVWSDGLTVHEGQISAKGGAFEGDGGFVEVSGSQLAFDGVVSTHAPHGNIGTVLLDPTNVTITTADSGGSFSGCTGGTNTFTPSSALTNTIAASTLAGLLNACNVTISTVGSSGTGTGAITVSSAVSWSSATKLTLTASSFMSITAAITNTSASTGFTSMAFTANGVSSGTNSGITLGSGGILTTAGGGITLNGTASGSGSTAVNGVYFNSGSIVTGGGNISVTGSVTGGSGASVGVLMATASAITASSASPNITISGTSLSTGANSHGVSITSAWTTGTSGLVTFSVCKGGNGAPSHGINMGSTFSTDGSVTAINQIIGGSGTGSRGFTTASNFQSTAGSISITASTTALGATASNGINLVGGTLSVNGTGTITLIGTASPNNSGSSAGVNISSTVRTGEGNIYIGGRVGAATGSSIGVILGSSLFSQSGSINVSGTSAASGSGARGLAFTSNWDSTTIGRVSFGPLITDGVVSIEGCQGGSGASSHGMSFAAMSFLGPMDAVNKIIGGTGTGSHGFAIVFPGHGAKSFFDIRITASTLAGGSTLSNGIHFERGNARVYGTNSFTLIGTGSPNNSGSTNGVYILGNPPLIESGCGSLNIAGTVPVGASAVGIGVVLAATNPVVGAGPINVSGTSFASGAGSHGVSIQTTWATGSPQAVTFGTLITDGAVSIEGCKGGLGTGSHGVDISAPLSTLGDIIATNNIFSGTGGGSSYGFNCASTLTSSGGNISIKATSLGTGTSCSGINITSTLQTSKMGLITLEGIGSSSATGSSNYGISVSGTGQISAISTAPVENLSLKGTPGAGTTIGTNLGGTGPISMTGSGSASIQSTSGSVGLSGTFAIGTGTLEFVSPCLLLGAPSFAVSGNLLFDSTIDGGFAFAVSSGAVSVSFSDAIGSLTPPTSIAIGSPLLLLDDIAITPATNGNISFTDTIDGPYSLTLTTAGSGIVSLSDSIGSIDPLDSLIVSGNSIALSCPVAIVNNVLTLTSPVTLSGSVVLSGLNVTVASTVTGNYPLSLAGWNTVSTEGILDLSGTTGASFGAYALEEVFIEAPINTSGTGSGGNVNIYSINSSIAVNGITTSAAGTSGGNIQLQASSFLNYDSKGWIPFGTVQIDATALTASGPTRGSIALSPTGRSITPSIATLKGNSDTNNNISLTCGAFSMGTNEAFTSYGNITINANISATLSDVVALNAMSVTSPSIYLRPRSAVQLLDSSGVLYTSPSAHLLAGSSPSFSSPVSPPGSHTGVSGAVEADLIYLPDDFALNFDTTAPIFILSAPSSEDPVFSLESID